MTKNQDRLKMPQPSEPAKQANQGKEPREPFSTGEVRRRVKRFLSTPETIIFPTHTLDRMEDHAMETTDVLNVFRGGAVWEQYQEFKAGKWRYCMGTSKFRIVFVFEEGAVCLITAIRLESKA